MERWLNSSFEDRESALISRRNGVPGFFIVGCPGFSSCCITEIDVPIDLGGGGVLEVVLQEFQCQMVRAGEVHYGENPLRK